MTLPKRKAVTDERPRKKSKTLDEEPKVSKTKNGKTKAHAPPTADADDRSRGQDAKSILTQEERSFPRGGGSILTPLEHKQIKAQAERDVLFELENKHSSRENPFDEDGLATGVASGKTEKKKRKKDKRSQKDVGDAEPAGVKIIGLSYKNLVVGASVLGRVTAITQRDVAIALPNNLTGYAPITAVSTKLNNRIEQQLGNEARRDDEDDLEADVDVDLQEMFYIGQWLKAMVVGTESEAVQGRGQTKRHIELDLDPRWFNESRSAESLVINSVLQASVRSVEDHGIVMDLGLADTTTRGFISKKDLGAILNRRKIHEGQVFLCFITGKGSGGQVLKLCPDPTRFSIAEPADNGPLIEDVPVLDVLQPGAAVEILITETGLRGVTGKVSGMFDVTADVFHSDWRNKGTATEQPTIGSKVKARILWSLPSDDGSRRIGVALSQHMLSLLPPSSTLPENFPAKKRMTASELDQKLPSSSILENAKVTRVLPERGLFFALSSPAGSPDKSLTGFAHISQLSDEHIDSLSPSSGVYKMDSEHRVRIISFNPVDNLYYVALKQSILDQAFLRLEDLTVGQKVKGKVEKLMLGGARGILGVLVNVAEGITGLVPETHLSDAQLKQPERRFKEGSSVKARVLSVDLEKRHLRLTLKRTLVDNDDETPIWQDYHDLEPGMESKGTVVNLLQHGAAVQFYNNVRAWLPVAEMSETFVDSPATHFRLGQTVGVRILSVDPDAREMKVSCKAGNIFRPEQQHIWDNIRGGEILTGIVSEKTAASVTVDLENDLRGIIRIGHLVDGSILEAENALKKIRVGQKMDSVLVLSKLERNHALLLSNKASLLKATRSQSLIQSLEDVKPGEKVSGFVRNINPEGIYVEFANAIVGLLPKSQLLPELITQPEFGLRKDQSLEIWVFHVDTVRERFSLTMRKDSANNAHSGKPALVPMEDIQNAADASIKSMADFTLGRVTVARIAAVKNTQINVRLADNVQGRVDASEVFDSWDEITNPKAPLQKFKQNELIEVKILGIHDTRNHRFLPISHRQGKTPVFELSAKRSRLNGDDKSLLSLDTVQNDSSHLAFINNHGENCIWVNLSPNVRGRVALMDLSDDVGVLQNVTKSFPTGCALRVNVKHVDGATGRLDLIAKRHDSAKSLALQDLSPGMILPAMITKVSERSVNVQLSESVAGPVSLVELTDDYDQVNPMQYNKNDIVRVCVVDIDRPNKRIFLSLRASRVLSSSFAIKDPQIQTATQLKPGDRVRGFVKQIGEKGVFVSLGARVDAFVKVADLSDQYVKEWQSIVEIDQLVTGRILSVDSTTKHVLMSLKRSHVDTNYEPPIGLTDLKPGMIVTGKVRKVEDFGAFIDIDKTQPRLSGLCHRSQVASHRVDDVRTLYSPGDIVKAKVLNVDVEGRKISLGLKASYFMDEIADRESDDEDESDDAKTGGVSIDTADKGSPDGETRHRHAEIQDLGELQDVPHTGDSYEDEDIPPETTAGLKTSGFDWTGGSFDGDGNGAGFESETEAILSKKRKHTKAEIKVDLTGDLDKYGPRSVSDFERQLLGSPNNSGLWVQYMAFQLQLGEVQAARDLAERALRTIHIRETEDKANVWIARLNLEVEYGDEARVEEAFEQACQVQEPLEMHGKLASIYIDSGKHDRAAAIFERTASNRNFRASPDLWLNYASFLMTTMKQPDRARALLSRSLQSVPSSERRLLTAKFAALEFHSAHGDPERGRTMFEGLVSEWPKWTSGWDMWTDLERARITLAETNEAKTDVTQKVRDLFERTAAQKMKKRRAKFVFKRWLEFEEAEGTEKTAEQVKSLAHSYVENAKAGLDETMEEDYE